MSEWNCVLGNGKALNITLCCGDGQAADDNILRSSPNPIITGLLHQVRLYLLYNLLSLCNKHVRWIYSFPQQGCLIQCELVCLSRYARFAHDKSDKQVKKKKESWAEALSCQSGSSSQMTYTNAPQHVCVYASTMVLWKEKTNKKERTALKSSFHV